jgi:hypothetical protein
VDIVRLRIQTTLKTYYDGNMGFSLRQFKIDFFPTFILQDGLADDIVLDAILCISHGRKIQRFNFDNILVPTLLGHWPARSK